LEGGILNGSNPGLPLSTDIGEGFIFSDLELFIMSTPVSFFRGITIGSAYEMPVFSLHLYISEQFSIACRRGFLFLSRYIGKQMKQK